MNANQLLVYRKNSIDELSKVCKDIYDSGIEMSLSDDVVQCILIEVLYEAMLKYESNAK